MFAASGNSFGDNGDGVIQTPTSAKFWLSSKHDNTITTTYTKEGTTTQDKPADLNGYTITKSITLNGIKWDAMITEPTNGSAITGIKGDAIDSNTAQVTITGTVAAQGQSFKYKYTNSTGTGVNTNSEQQLPSSVKTIKIVLKNGTGGRRA